MLSMRAAVHDVDPRVVAWRTDSVERLFADAIARPRIVLLSMLIFAGLGLFLAAAGVYGVLSHAVVQRRREMGIRLALGARPAAVGALIARNGLAMTAAGLVAGVGIALALTGAMRSLLYEVEPTDPLSIVYVAGLLLGVAAVACWHPVRRAMRIDPASLLREE
jgi:ABC-type antimicrobial peptide transport system permease subunit